MRFRIREVIGSRRSTLAVWLSALATLSFIVAGVTSAQQPQDGRPRTTTDATATSTPTPPQPAPTPEQTGPGRRVVPQLGAPPAPPVFRPKPTPTPDAATAEIDEGSTITINADLVTLNVRVIDRNNRPIGNIRQAEFKVYEDGVAQPIFSFTEEEVPVIYGLAVDTSGSLRGAFDQVMSAAKTIIDSNKPGDETFIERFISSDKIEIVTPFTAKKDELMDGLDTLYIEGGQTAVIDGVYLAAQHTANHKQGGDDRRRRALIVITDGEDRASYYSQEQLFSELREQDVQIYVIGIVADLDAERGLIRRSPRQKAMDLINKLATETGGRAFFPQSISELPTIAREIVRDLRTQYVISYDPTNKTHDGTYRAIKVNVAQPGGAEKRIALTRSGRTALPPGTASRPSTPPNNVRPTPNNPRRPPQ